MSFALYQSLAWTQPGFFATRWLRFNHSCTRNFQTGILAGLNICRQARSKASRTLCANRSPTSSFVRYIFSGKGSGERVQSLEDIAKLIRNRECHRIVVMSGAGISTPSGIPDFRSPGSGLYDNLQQYDIPYPEAIFEINYFSHNPKPFFALAKQLYPGNCKPNYTHYFVRVLHHKLLLQRMYTQNIDGLERMAGIPPEKLVEAHGTFATATCTVCMENFSWEQLRGDIMERKVPHCPSCFGVIKPDIIFFGEQLPAKFHQYIIDFPFADLLIILGTSLEVEPFASLSEMVRESVPRVLFNQDLVGSITRNPLRVNDVVELGDIVSGVKKFSEMLGWHEEVNDLLSTEHEKLDRDIIQHSE
ncbi:NAD-dependent protein deacetylase sirtuin-3, mitochondrial isoform X1 [Hemiscyllium ocellatum]|uniref:NAD-dependent protein deacetylase sirtuin-3, mitochondrial isoform X1 n=1 Tax=Hemiscyllium ocellatum TaxID=170820 RepID=UPI0029672D89|nr:NAD-dependent protein deacetylase sirtuin-3, mitochondrial isoform X1 [Hemiscyllium ocellatum]